MAHNSSYVRFFFLSGLNGTMNYRVALFSLTLLCYCFIVLVNVALIVTIILDKNMHEPMYILLCTFCMNGLCGTTGFYPKILWDLLSPVHVISYSGCLVQAFVMYSFASSDLSILAVMSYDRYVAICRPLEYHSIMSKQRVLLLVCFSLLTPFCIIGTNVILTSRLKLCSPYIERLFCVNWVIVKLACFSDDTIVNNIVGYITIIIYVFHGLFIVWSYMYVIKTCVNSLENRAKFMQTCVPHLTSLLIFLVTILFDIMHIRYGSTDLPQALNNFIAIQFLVIPPIMNPLVYGFKLTKIRKRILGRITVKM
ncbi:olfactory receptor 13C4-like [Cyclopterus lumpus]|uniref:G-protein coupled receptors family 1 profile domain-containing protein n=1 Tax=Cyclopterus lumpus TaxID=8103 RepID=A0A8C3A755_CYCLU|nr:olfactory receptor 13C4-like [Cyclopterus lumpus]